MHLKKGVVSTYGTGSIRLCNSETEGLLPQNPRECTSKRWGQHLRDWLDSPMRQGNRMAATTKSARIHLKKVGSALTKLARFASATRKPKICHHKFRENAPQKAVASTYGTGSIRLCATSKPKGDHHKIRVNAYQKGGISTYGTGSIRLCNKETGGLPPQIPRECTSKGVASTYGSGSIRLCNWETEGLPPQIPRSEFSSQLEQPHLNTFSKGKKWPQTSQQKA